MIKLKKSKINCCVIRKQNLKTKNKIKNEQKWFVVIKTTNSKILWSFEKKFILNKEAFQYVHEEVNETLSTS